jgi:hypothetical protein
MFGKATVNGAGSFDFVIDVDDLGEPGTGVDKFRIQLSNGYTARIIHNDWTAQHNRDFYVTTRG